jgi:hypothetical protein
MTPLHRPTGHLRPAATLGGHPDVSCHIVKFTVEIDSHASSVIPDGKQLQ